MKWLTLIIVLMNANTLTAQDGRAKTTKKTFHQVTAVQIDIEADAAIVWALLTNASDFARWNTTIVSLEGEIKQGQKLRLVSTLDDSRTFKLKVKQLIPEQSMTWGDGKGSRVFTLTKVGNGVRFSMSEKIGGLMFPMYAKYLPPFEESFDQFAADLKAEAEEITRAK